MPVKFAQHPELGEWCSIGRNPVGHSLDDIYLRFTVRGLNAQFHSDKDA